MRILFFDSNREIHAIDLRSFKMVVRQNEIYKAMLAVAPESPASTARGWHWLRISEILATGQQFVAFGIHPETLAPYRWSEASPLDVPAIQGLKLDGEWLETDLWWLE